MRRRFALLLATLGVTLVASPVHAGKRDLEAAIQHQLALTRSAADVQKALKSLERERASLAYAQRLLGHRADESLRRLSAYSSARGAREGQAKVRARALYKLARGGLPRLYFEDLAPGARSERSADRITRGRTVRWLVRHDLRELSVHRRAESRARAELLAASREMAAVSAVRMVEGLQSSALEQFDESLAPSLLAAVQKTRKLEKGPTTRRLQRMVEKAKSEYATLRRAKGFDLLERRSLPRPVPGKIVGRFGRHFDKDLQLELERKGLELRAKGGKPAKSIAPGKVAYVGALPGYDQVVVIDHGGGYLTMTGRLLDVQVHAGDELEAGTVLGRVAPAPPDASLGTTVYLELRHGERPIDPTRFLRRR